MNHTIKYFQGKKDGSGPQARAFEYADEIGGVIMSYDVGSGKGFVCGKSYDELYSHLNSTYTPNNWHFYDMAREGMPVRFFMDLEFDRGFNPQHNVPGKEQQMLKVVCQIVKNRLQIAFNVICEQSYLQIFTASDNSKCSYHVIIAADSEFYFENMQALAAFMKVVQAEIDDNDSHRELLRTYKKDNKQDCFVDFSVYTKNRQFRTCFSTKRGSSRMFVPVGEGGGYQGKSLTKEEKKSFWMNSLIGVPGYISSTNPTCRILGICHIPASLQKKVKPIPPKGSIMESSSQTFNVADFTPTQDKLLQRAEQFMRKYNPNCKFTKCGISNFNPEIMWFGFSNSRYCPYIQREHKSNNTYVKIRTCTGQAWICCQDEQCKSIKKTLE